MIGLKREFRLYLQLILLHLIVIPLTLTKDAEEPPQILLSSQPQPGNPTVEPFDHLKDSPNEDFDNVTLRQNEVNDQTMLIVEQLIVIHLGGKESRTTANSMLWANSSKDIAVLKFVQLARGIMERFCPPESLSPFVLSFMVRVFRLLHLDTVQIYPLPETLAEESAINAKIIEALTTCRDTLPVKVSSFLRNLSCPGQGPFTGSRLSDGRIFLDGSNMSSIPDHVRFDLLTLDISLETVWKMMLLVNYLCPSNFFSPHHFSEFVVKFEALFNPALLYRWYHSGASNTVLGLVLSGYDLKGFATSVDHCVATANAMSTSTSTSTSTYNGWVRRPADALYWTSHTPIAGSHDRK